jgi:hypothetical protein
MTRPVADDVIAVLSEIRHRFESSGPRASIPDLRLDAIKAVAIQEFSAQRFLDQRSAKESIYDACARRLGHIPIGAFDRLVEEWLNGKPDALRLAVQAKTTTEAQRRRLSEVLVMAGSSPIHPTAPELEPSPAERTKTTVSRIVRDTRLSKRVKMLHDYECQVCGFALTLPDGSRYAEGHHIRPLGTPHDGSDVLGNILCLCPNHHAACDLGAIQLVRGELRHAVGHSVEQMFLDYHNSMIYQAASRSSTEFGRSADQTRRSN